MAWAREFDRRRGLRETGETAVTEHEWTNTMLSVSPQAPAQPEPLTPGQIAKAVHEIWQKPDHPMFSDEWFEAGVRFAEAARKEQP